MRLSVNRHVRGCTLLTGAYRLCAVWRKAGGGGKQQHTQNPIGQGLKAHTYLCSSLQMMTPWQVINNAGFVGRGAAVTEKPEASAGVIRYSSHTHLKSQKAGIFYYKKYRLLKKYRHSLPPYKMLL